MENVIYFAFLYCCLMIIAGSEGQSFGDVRIENCIDNVIDIQENSNNTILCKGFNVLGFIEWTVIRRNEKTPRAVATCDASYKCTVHQPGHFAVERSPSHSTLFYQQYDRQVDKGATVTCSSLYLSSNRSKTCSLNVITTRSPDLSSPANNVDSTTSPGVSLLTTTDGVDYTSPNTQEENVLPVGAIVGGIVSVVAVVIIVMVVVVVFLRRKRKQKPLESPYGSSNDVTNENDNFEEHINPMYVTNDGQDSTHSTDHKPSAIAMRISSNSHNGHPAAPHSLEADMYTTVDGEARHVPSYQASSMGDRSGGYEDIGFDSNGNKRVPQKDEYAVVDKSRAKKGPASSANTSVSSPDHTTEGSDEYAVVDKSSSRNKTAKTVASGLSDAATNNAGADVYAQVNKPAKKVMVAEPETEVAAYAQVQKPKPAVKPKTSAKPSSNKDATQRSAADDDEYHTLSHTRGSPETQDQADLESQYSHIGHE